MGSWLSWKGGVLSTAALAMGLAACAGLLGDFAADGVGPGDDAATGSGDAGDGSTQDTSSTPSGDDRVAMGGESTTDGLTDVAAEESRMDGALDRAALADVADVVVALGDGGSARDAQEAGDAPSDSPFDSGGCPVTELLCNGACVPNDVNHCGSCATACTSIQQCTNGSCIPICNAASCVSGCCSGAVCLAHAGQSASMCGTAGATCSTCAPGNTCQGGVCGPPPTWCGQQAIPSGVAAADYQCVDFDKGLPPTTTWGQTQAQGGTLSLSTALASSAPTSLLTSVPAATDATTSGTASLSWTDIGATAVTGATVTAAINPVAVGGLLAPWTGSISILCVTFNASPSSHACLEYTINASSARELDIVYALVNGAAVAGKCVVAGAFTPGLWNQVSLSWAASGVSATVSGTTTPCGVVGPPPTTSATATFGPAASAVTSVGWSVYYDSVVAYMQR
ncbi:MAG: hypothetical protein M3O46_21770 [Myxococcota bacterium]|nr:hypothetical protein [Myxococcota bacterium]